MSIFTEPLPLSLYIHIPWCVRKCPYCDFNSHAIKNDIPETLYVSALLQELESYLPIIQNRAITSVFFGGGTPSLFSGKAIATILQGIKQSIFLAKEIEITLEANPGTIDQARFEDFYQAGINRLSLGIQSFQDEKLQKLGRIHESKQAAQAIRLAKQAGFSRFNIDLMYGLPDQSLVDVMYDLETALSFEPPHLSWYQLTLEPNTLFYRQPPLLPSDDAIWDMQIAGQSLLEKHCLHRYEVSAYALPKERCNHNLNYWTFGDYLGLGAGAHSKITQKETGEVRRFSQVKHPKDYLDPSKRILNPSQPLGKEDLIFEFMLNALRLSEGVPIRLFTERTGLPVEVISSILHEAKKRNLMIDHPSQLCASPFGMRFLNDLTALFLPQSSHKN